MDGKTEKNRRTEQKSGILRSISRNRKENADAGSPSESLREPFSQPESVQGYGFSCVLFRDTTRCRQQRPKTPIRICFRNSGNKIVRYGIDGIELRDRKNQTLWSDHYTMENPQMISCGDAIAFMIKTERKLLYTMPMERPAKLPRRIRS